ncbi:MAG: hypothetical protein LBL73_08860 [Synergistaceae bacterium]|nr:hypothetical protein [Synergistaceae bacterium]
MNKKTACPISFFCSPMASLMCLKAASRSPPLRMWPLKKYTPPPPISGLCLASM